ncbi:hypothetical protein OSH10_08290 [Kaistia defluvii]|uniref:hypothetical protein n=1 Tax=Kaistia defluvii TaxID=410841 RepID=UPI0022554877|nr:hypothetical protein [Kaistia defluvii]MCX5518432.1 hypothetical protein [Kaistia defluvii]
MAFVLKDRVRVNSATTGTGAIALGAAVANAAKGYYRTFAAAGVANGDTVPYLIEDGANWETGIGTYASAGTVLARTAVINNSAGTTAPINLSGSAEVAIVLTEACIATLAEAQAGTSSKLLPASLVNVARTWTAPQRSTPVPIESGTSMTADLTLGQDFDIAAYSHLGTLSFSGMASAIGQKGCITGKNASGSRTLGYGSGANPVGSSSAPPIPPNLNDRWRIDYHVRLDGTVDYSVSSVGV